MNPNLEYRLLRFGLDALVANEAEEVCGGKIQARLPVHHNLLRHLPAMNTLESTIYVLAESSSYISTSCPNFPS